MKFKSTKEFSRPLPLIAAGGLTIIAGGILLASGGISAQEHRYPTRPDSFAYIQVDDTSELVAMFQKNPQLRKNYARHYKIPESEVVRFVKEALIPYELPKTRKVTTFGVRKNGKIYPVVKTLPRGTRVWATRSGEPLIKWICTNPIGYKLPGTDLGKPTMADPAPVVQSYSVASAARADIEVLEDDELAPQLVALEMPTEPIPVVPEQPISQPTVTATPAPAAGRDRSALALLPLAGAVLAATRGGGDSAPSTVIPEPGTLALMALAGVSGLALLRRRK